MSGNPAPPTVDLTGTAMSALVRAIPATEALAGRPVTVVGGLAVICRLARPYRATSDLDIVNRRTADEPSQLEVLIARGAQPSGVSGALVTTSDGPVQVDVLEVSDADLSHLPDDPTDRLHVLAHAWAAHTATQLRLRADGQGLVTVAVAEPGTLIAMKLQSVMNRGRDKEATDLLDIIQLTLDRTTGPGARAALATAESQLRADAALHADSWFRAGADRTLRSPNHPRGIRPHPRRRSSRRRTPRGESPSCYNLKHEWRPSRANYPKLPGEPMRVQPSRERMAHAR